MDIHIEVAVVARTEVAAVARIEVARIGAAVVYAVVAYIDFYQPENSSAEGRNVLDCLSTNC